MTDKTDPEITDDERKAVVLAARTGDFGPLNKARAARGLDPIDDVDDIVPEPDTPPMTDAEFDELIGVCLMGPLPWLTVQRLITYADAVRAERDKLRQTYTTRPTAVELRVDPERRLQEGKRGTGIYVRAKLGGIWDSWDLAELDGSSVLAWLRERGHRNTTAENTVLGLLGLDRIAEDPK